MRYDIYIYIYMYIYIYIYVIRRLRVNDQMKKNVSRGACNTYRGEGRCIRGFDEET